MEVFFDYPSPHGPGRGQFRRVVKQVPAQGTLVRIPGITEEFIVEDITLDLNGIDDKWTAHLDTANAGPTTLEA